MKHQNIFVNFITNKFKIIKIMYEKFGQFIDGKWQPSEKNETYEVINPATEEILGHASKATPKDVDKALKSAEKGLKVWKQTPPCARIIYN